ncbi:hypothetical protein FisN_5Hh170 [Fistulifera solaris]|uniref:Fascin-like domain-containing protein n=1 Tax=Fistulifera solaris TaxID=1519565 RepID=A0A1Z5JS75_FISSO|nr:hypothetical protein FisN_5Hh170 [Fistulifera solaris]|eukprot:GAX16799.1 hypothetical protein FisN_5Hh170 [Fistulifera solaris]
MRARSSFINVPCIEPLHCHLISRSKSGGKLSVDHQNVASSSASRNEWQILRTANSSFVFQAVGTNQFLCLEDDEILVKTVRSLETPQGENKFPSSFLWKIQAHSSIEGAFFLVSEEGKPVACNANGVQVWEKISDSSSLAWSFDFLSGELVHIICPVFQKLIQCHGVLPGPRLNTKFGGWETWRLIEAGNNTVYITSWTHGHVLGANAQGDLELNKRSSRDEWDRWIVIRGTSGEGVYLRSMKAKRYLATDGTILDTCRERVAMHYTTIWHLEPPNRNVYHLRSRNHGYLSANLDDQLCMNRDCHSKGGHFQFERREGGNEGDCLAIKSLATGKYIALDTTTRELFCSEISYWWHVEEYDSLSRGLVFITSTGSTPLVLNCGEEGKLAVSTDIAFREENAWRLEPHLPDSLTKAQCISVGAVITGGVAAMVAAPLAFTAMVASIGLGSRSMTSNKDNTMTKEGSLADGSNEILQTIGVARLGSTGKGQSLINNGPAGGSGVSGTTATALLRSAESSSQSTGDHGDFADASLFGSADRPFSDWRYWEDVARASQ